MCKEINDYNLNKSVLLSSVILSHSVSFPPFLSYIKRSAATQANEFAVYLRQLKVRILNSITKRKLIKTYHTHIHIYTHTNENTHMVT